MRGKEQRALLFSQVYHGGPFTSAQSGPTLQRDLQNTSSPTCPPLGWHSLRGTESWFSEPGEQFSFGRSLVLRDSLVVNKVPI